MKIIVSVGHSILRNGSYTSAIGCVNEYRYCSQMSKILIKKLREVGVETFLLQCPELKLKNKTEEKTYKLPRVNATKNCDLCIELHLNASVSSSAQGCEVLYFSESGKKYGDAICKALSKFFHNRGSKERKDLYMLNSTKPVTIILESFFCTSAEDTHIGRIKTNEICDEIVKAITETFKIDKKH